MLAPLNSKNLYDPHRHHHPCRPVLLDRVSGVEKESMNDPKLKLNMASLLPEQLFIIEGRHCWVETRDCLRETEWLYVMHLVEQTCLDREEFEHGRYYMILSQVCSSEGTDPNGAAFNQRATAMCKVKGIEV